MAKELDKKGDILECKNNSGAENHLTIGKEYVLQADVVKKTIVNSQGYPFDLELKAKIINDKGDVVSVNLIRFYSYI
jgi:hypothetical protein